MRLFTTLLTFLLIIGCFSANNSPGVSISLFKEESQSECENNFLEYFYYLQYNICQRMNNLFGITELFGSEILNSTKSLLVRDSWNNDNREKRIIFKFYKDDNCEIENQSKPNYFDVCRFSSINDNNISQFQEKSVKGIFPEIYVNFKIKQVDSYLTWKKNVKKYIPTTSQANTIHTIYYNDRTCRNFPSYANFSVFTEYESKISVSNCERKKECRASEFLNESFGTECVKRADETLFFILAIVGSIVGLFICCGIIFLVIFCNRDFYWIVRDYMFYQLREIKYCFLLQLYSANQFIIARLGGRGFISDPGVFRRRRSRRIIDSDDDYMPYFLEQEFEDSLASDELYQEMSQDFEEEYFSSSLESSTTSNFTQEEAEELIEEEEETVSSICKICKRSRLDAVFSPCGCVACKKCYRKLKEPKICPFCGKDIEGSYLAHI